MASLTDEIRDDIQAGGALADATAEGLAQEYAAQIAAAPTAEAAGDRYLAIRTTYRSRGLGVPAPVIAALRARFGEVDEDADETLSTAQRAAAQAHTIAAAADEAFTCALRLHYGKAAAGDARYRPHAEMPEHIRPLAQAFRSASAAHSDACEALRAADMRCWNLRRDAEGQR